MDKRLSATILIASCMIIMFHNVSASNTHDIPKQLTDHMASREMRYHHFLWHNLRNVWHTLDRATQREISRLGWTPPRPAYHANGTVNRDNNSGEDFLYMHREKITEANRILSRISRRRRVTGFKTIPLPGDPEYPVPRGGENENYARWKTDEFFWERIKPAEERFTNPEFLRTVTLGQLGAMIEFGIHNHLHIRFSNTTSEVRPTESDLIPHIDKRWDDPSYNWLLDTYASHVHPLFWKIHGWVDDRIEDWRRANNVSTIRWRGRWRGGPMSSIDAAKGTHSHGSHNRRLQKKAHNIDVMEKVVRLLLKAKKCYYYYCYAQN